MGCDYYIQKELVIEYLDKTGKIFALYTDRNIEKGYILQSSEHDSDDDEDTSYKKYKEEIERRIKYNTYNKILFENGDWVQESYKKKYEQYLLRTYKEIVKIIKIYKKNTAWERM